MKAGDLIDLLMLFDNGDEIEIKIYERGSGRYVDSTAAVQILDEDIFVPTLKNRCGSGKVQKNL